MTNVKRTSIACTTVLLTILTGYGQTQVDVRAQARNFDLSGANSTRPMKTGTSLPAQCTVGDMFFKSDAPAGQNVYGCTGTNVWTVQSVAPGSGGGTTGTSSMTVTALAGKLSVGTCTPSAPCNVGVGNKTYQYTTDGTSVSLTTTGVCTLYAYIDTVSGNRAVGRDSACVTSITLLNLVDAPGVKAFPATSIPLGTCAAVNNAINSCIAMTPSFTRELLKNGPNITLTPNASDGSITIDSIAGVPAPIFASAGLGYHIPFFGPDGAGTEIGVPVAKQVKYWQITVPAQMIVRKIAGRQGTAGAGGHFSFALYDSTKSKIAQFSTVNDNPGGIFTATTSPVVINAGVYFIAFTSDNTALRLYGTGGSTDYATILSGQPGAEQRFFLGAATNLASGTASLSLPSSFAADSVTPLQEPLPKLVLLP